MITALCFEVAVPRPPSLELLWRLPLAALLGYGLFRLSSSDKISLQLLYFLFSFGYVFLCHDLPSYRFGRFGRRQKTMFSDNFFFNKNRGTDSKCLGASPLTTGRFFTVPKSMPDRTGGTRERRDGNGTGSQGGRTGGFPDTHTKGARGGCGGIGRRMGAGHTDPTRRRRRKERRAEVGATEFCLRNWMLGLTRDGRPSEQTCLCVGAATDRERGNGCWN